MKSARPKKTEKTKEKAKKVKNSDESWTFLSCCPCLAGKDNAKSKLKRTDKTKQKSNEKQNSTLSKFKSKTAIKIYICIGFALLVGIGTTIGVLYGTGVIPKTSKHSTDLPAVQFVRDNQKKLKPKKKLRGKKAKNKLKGPKRGCYCRIESTFRKI